jgi:nucleoside-diphosphate-sugar epimerase
MLTITGANSPLGRALITALTPHSPIRAVDIAFDAPLDGATCLAGDLRDAEFAAQAADGASAIVHLEPLYTRFVDDHDSLDYATRGTYLLADAAAKANVARFILGSSLRIYPPALTARYHVNESWRPRPGTDLDSLCAWLGEVCTRETVRVTGTPAVCLRLGVVMDDAMVAGQPFNPYWLHIDDAVQAIRCALDADLSDWTGWGVAHIGAAGGRAALSSAKAANEPLRYAPAHDFANAPASQAKSPAEPTAIHSRPIKRVVIFGAGGPLAATATTALAQAYALRLTDVKPIDELVATLQPQTPGAPLPTVPQPPHEWRVVDVCDAAQVMAACEGADAIINCTVIRYDLASAFRVNMLGAWNVMRAAVAHDIHRVVHTGPFMLGDRGRVGYDWDYDIVDDVPPRPGTSWLYFLSKLCGQEIVRAFAEVHGLSVPTLTFCDFRNPDVHRDPPLHPLTVSWPDAGQAIRCALEAPTLPAPFEYFHVGADLPHGVYHNDKAKRLLGWQPRDRFEDYTLR